jgi:hypothetical protein
VGFGESWEDVAFLVSSGLRDRMRPLERVAPTGARWLEANTNGGFVRALWSDALSLPLRLESGRVDGTWSATVSVELVAPLPCFPGMKWAALSDAT